jgi:hypothetical protein
VTRVPDGLPVTEEDDLRGLVDDAGHLSNATSQISLVDDIDPGDIQIAGLDEPVELELGLRARTASVRVLEEEKLRPGHGGVKICFGHQLGGIHANEISSDLEYPRARGRCIAVGLI